MVGSRRLVVAGRKLLFYVTEDWYFVSHRLALGVAAQAAGHDVAVVTRVREHGDVVRRAGLRLIPFENARSSLNPIKELWALLRLIRVYRRERPAIVHHVAMKPVIYGTIAAMFAGRPRVINALAGMGWLFTSGAGAAQWLKPLVRWGLSRLLRSGVTLVQNSDDAQFLAELGIPRSNIALVPGSGVDLMKFTPQPEPLSTPVVVLPARLLWDKGVAEFVSAARSLRQQGIAARFVLAGEPDFVNPSAVPSEEVRRWVQEGVVEHLGWVTDMPRLMAESHVICLPSYREGMPKSLLEAAAAGRPIVTTDTPGCREIVRDGENGFLVPPRDAKALSDALRRLIQSAALRKQMGERGRARAEATYGLDAIIEQTLNLYAEAAR